MVSAETVATMHTPMSAKGRTVAVFGCGGDRYRTKRPLMGKAAADWSDFAVVTTDNPRTEQPEDEDRLRRSHELHIAAF